ncbi:MAG: hypothetical protein ACI8SE_001929 [Bacteroidia bacterium]|jgi:hypothetical protein
MHLIRTHDNKARAFKILETSFCGAPGLTWMINQKKAERSIKHLIHLMYHEAAYKRGNFVTTDKNGVVLFFQLNNKTIAPLQILRSVFVILFVTGVRKGIKALKYKKKVASIRPKKGWLGHLVATDRSVVGNAAAFEIKSEMFRIADEHNECIYLETTVPRVRRLYKAAGYVEYAELKHPYADLMIWFFRRQPSIE